MAEPAAANLPDPPLGRQVIEACLAMGFALAGIAPAEPTAFREQFLAWLAAGRHGDMAYMTEMVEQRLDVRKVLPGARSVIVIADQYAPRTPLPSTGPDPNPAPNPNLLPTPSSTPASGLIAKYARGRDYHSVIKKRLKSLCDTLRRTHPRAEFRIFVDTGPSLEREHASRAGLGFIGKHTLLINPHLGSYLLLGGIATTLDIQSPRGDAGAGASALSQANSRPSLADEHHCGSCTLCIDACPTQAISPYEVDATRCISYLTLEHRGPIDGRFHAAVGDRLIGCDVCQDVCPFNQAHSPAHQHPRINPAYADPDGLRARLPILEVLNWTEPDRTRSLAQSAAKRSSLPMIRRNALIAAGNALARHQDPVLSATINRISSDESEDPLVRETARQVRAAAASRGP